MADEIARDRELAQEAHDEQWKEVRRSTPAEHVYEVPDHATVWACWIHTIGNAAVTIYKSSETQFHVVTSRGPEQELVGQHESEQNALDDAASERDKLTRTKI